MNDRADLIFGMQGKDRSGMQSEGSRDSVYTEHFYTFTVNF